MRLEDLERVRNEIERFSAIHQQQVYDLLVKGEADIQKTSQGVLVNLGTIPDNVLEDIITHAKYVKDQEVRITQDEKAKAELRENYFGASAEHA